MTIETLNYSFSMLKLYTLKSDVNAGEVRLKRALAWHMADTRYFHPPCMSENMQSRMEQMLLLLQKQSVISLVLNIRSFEISISSFMRDR